MTFIFRGKIRNEFSIRKWLSYEYSEPVDIHAIYGPAFQIGSVHLQAQ